LYLTLAQNRSTKVRRTLAASLGELAMVIGPDNARRDLVNVWWDAMRCEEDCDIRLKAIEAVPTLVDALGEGEARDGIFAGLIKLWEEGWLRNWRAREGVINILPDLVGSLTHPECVHQLLKRGLEDDFGAVREVSISMVSRFYRQPFATITLPRSRGCGRRAMHGLPSLTDSTRTSLHWLIPLHSENG
jgi:serine/threonine-protein phosphatase 4 regulatory subunit 1